MSSRGDASNRWLDHVSEPAPPSIHWKSTFLPEGPQKYVSNISGTLKAKRTDTYGNSCLLVNVFKQFKFVKVLNEIERHIKLWDFRFSRWKVWRCCSMYSGIYLLTFQKYLLPPSGLYVLVALIMEAASRSVNFRQTTKKTAIFTFVVNVASFLGTNITLFTPFSHWRCMLIRQTHFVTMSHPWCKFCHNDCKRQHWNKKIMQKVKAFQILNKTQRFQHSNLAYINVYNTLI
jgi:hypothetical protein